MIKILLDTDIGGDIDDAVCLAYLLREPECALLGITIVCGDAEVRASVADAICRAAGRRVPIIVGEDMPLQPIPCYPTPEGATALANWPHDQFHKGDAPEFLYQKICENPHEVVLLAIGNVTNVAIMLQRHPDAAGLLKGVYTMNGYFGKAKLPDPMYNWNAWADPLATKLLVEADIPQQRMVPLEVTEMLTIDAKCAKVFLPDQTTLMRCVYDFGNAWLESSNQLTLHDPLAAVCIFHPEVCTYERGFISVETEDVSDMAATRFTPSANGNVEIARTVDKGLFYHILSSALSGRRCVPPPRVMGKAVAAGEAGLRWMEKLDSLADALETQWNVRIGSAMNGGTHAYVAHAQGEDGGEYIVKIDLPDNPVEEFLNNVEALRIADGNGYAKLYAWDTDRRACLLEKLGVPLKKLGYSPDEQMEIICDALKRTWQMPVGDSCLKDGRTSIEWFGDFIPSAWEQMGRPCPHRVIDQAMKCLRARDAAMDPSEFVLVHGDAHNNNTLAAAYGKSFKLIDPDGLVYEKAYDLGVLMREWPEEYRAEAKAAGYARSKFLSRLTGVDARSIWEWGYLQMVATSMILLQIGDDDLAREMLSIAEAWCE